MIKIMISGIHCRLSLLFPAVLLYLLYLDPSGMVLFGFLASVIHECGHISTAFFLRCPPEELVVSCFGMRMVTRSSCVISSSKEIWIALAGPMMNMLTFFVAFFLSPSSIYSGIHLVMAVFNLLPVYPLDGGRVIRVFVDRTFGEEDSKRIETAIFFLILIPMVWLGVLLLIHPSHNATLLMVTIYLIFVRLFHNGN